MKASHHEANYGKGGTEKRCGLCTMYRPPGACTAVESPIASDAVCDYFRRKSPAETRYKHQSH